MLFRTTLAAALLLTSAAAVSQHQGATVEERLQRLEDESAIRRIIEDYTVLLTSRDFDGYAELFAEEGTWRNGDLVKRGRAEIKEMLLTMFPDTPADFVNDHNYMLVSNIRVDVHGDTASAHSRQLTIQRDKDGNPKPILSGVYEDEFVRRNGQWKFLSRNDITLIPTREQWGKLMAEGILSGE